MSGWNLVNSHKLRQELKEAVRDNASRQEIINVIKLWWNMPENSDARINHLSAKEVTILGVASAADFGGEYLEHILERAKINPLVWDGLRQWSYKYVSAGNNLRSDIASLLLQPNGRPSKRGQPEGQAPSKFNTDNQLAAIVGLLRTETRYKSLSTVNKKSGSVNDTSPFVIASEATNKPLDVVRKAWNSHKYIFKG